MELDRPLYLASASPRRIELVRQLGLHARVCPADVDESAEGSPGKRVLELARRKALHVAGQHQRGLVLGADTLVSIGRRVLGKPRDEEQAFEMLRALCGHWHRVYTGPAPPWPRPAPPAFRAWAAASWIASGGIITP